MVKSIGLQESRETLREQQCREECARILLNKKVAKLAKETVEYRANVEAGEAGSGSKYKINVWLYNSGEKESKE